jgi:ABC-type transport system involved in multi-copper enzyme maturation permease subunit
MSTNWEQAAIGGGAVAALAMLVAALVLYRRRVRMLGPMFWYEMVKLARRGQQPRLRALLVGLLLVGLLVAYLREFRADERWSLLFGSGTKLDLARHAQFAEGFLVTFLIAQLAAVILITPAVVGSAISEEKERGTLDFLRSSLLTNREIVLGKLAARLAFVGGVVLAGVPVLALTTLFGGVDISVVFGGYLIAAVTALSLGAFSLLMGVYRDTLRDVLVWVYGVALVFAVFGSCCGCIPGVAAVSPVSALGWMFIHPQAIPSEPLFWVNLGLFAGLHGLFALGCVLFAVHDIRSAPPRRRAPQPTRRYWPRTRPEWAPPPRRAYPVREDDEEPRPSPRARRAFPVPRLGDANPFVWKERYFAGRLSWVEGGLFSGCGIAALSVMGFVLGLILFFSAMDELEHRRWVGRAVNPVARIFLTGAAMVMGLALGIRTAGAVASERQKQTLDGLLTLPVNREQILRGKWLAPLLWARPGLIAIACVAVFALITAGLHPLGLIVGLLQIAGWLAVTVSLGLWLSVRCRTVTRATVYFLVWMLALWLGPVVLAPVADVFNERYGYFTLQFSLPAGAGEGLFGWGDLADEASGRRWPQWVAGRIVGACVGVLYVALAGLLWLGAVRAFEREGR